MNRFGIFRRRDLFGELRGRACGSDTFGSASFILHYIYILLLAAYSCVFAYRFLYFHYLPTYAFTIRLLINSALFNNSTNITLSVVRKKVGHGKGH